MNDLASNSGAMLPPLITMTLFGVARQLICVEKKAGESYGAARFDDQLCFKRKPANRLANFIVSDGDDVVDVLRNVPKVDLAD